MSCDRRTLVRPFETKSPRPVSHRDLDSRPHGLGRLTSVYLDYERLREEVSIKKVLSLIGWTTVSKQGDQLRGPCPIHRSKGTYSRSFSVHLTKNAFRCFACGVSGNQLDLYAQVTKLPLYEAAIDLCHRLRVELPIRPKTVG